jgi:hypothetical protein
MHQLQWTQWRRQIRLLLLLVRRLPAWSGNTGKRLVCAPKFAISTA